MAVFQAIHANQDCAVLVLDSAGAAMVFAVPRRDVRKSMVIVTDVKGLVLRYRQVYQSGRVGLVEVCRGDRVRRDFVARTLDFVVLGISSAMRRIVRVPLGSAITVRED